MFGKLLGGLIGFSILSPLGIGVIGLLVGVAAGHSFDKGSKAFKQRLSPEQREKIQTAFLEALFPVLGHLAKADGRICESEIAGTEKFMAELGLTGNARKAAIENFKLGSNDDFDIDVSLRPLKEAIQGRADLQQIFMVYLINLAYADGDFHTQEEKVLEDVATALGFSRFMYSRLLGMVQAQMHFQQRHQGRSQGAYSAQSSANELENAYKALGVESSATDPEVKKAYRRLMSEYHPDKLAGQGVPDEMIKTATERSQEIQTAYEMIKKSRKAS